MKLGIIVAAAGSSTRMGGEGDKLLMKIYGRHIFDICLFNISQIVEIEHIIVSTKPSLFDKLRDCLSGSYKNKLSFVEGGATRGASIRNALDAIDFDYDAILIHDAARPLLSKKVYARIRAGLETHDAVIPYLNVSDSCYRLTEEGLSKVDREGLIRVQTPQAFRKRALDLIIEAYKKEPEKYTDEASICLEKGLDLCMVEGSKYLEKLTYQADLPYLESLYKHFILEDI